MRYILITVSVFICLLPKISFTQTDSLNISWDRNAEQDSVEHYILFYAHSNTKTTFSNQEYDTLKFINQTPFSISRVQTVDTNTAYIKPGNFVSYRVIAVDSQGIPSDFSDPAGAGIPQIRWQQTVLDSGESTTLLKSDFLFDLDNNPTELTLNISQEENIQITQVTNGIRLAPTPITFTGQARFRLGATDPDGFHDNKLITVNIVNTSEPNNTPFAEDDFGETDQNQPQTINVLLNDSDPDGDPIFINDLSQPLHGSVINNEDSTITYSPDLNYTGSDSFNYEISDGRGGLATASVYLEINPVEPPVNKLIAYPNPFRGQGDNRIIFDPIPDGATEIFIITLSDELVYNEKIDQYTGRRWEWPVITNGKKQVASGVYLYVIKGKGNQKLASGKIAIIR